MTREDATMIATERVLAGPLNDFRRGLIDQDKLVEMAGRRYSLIAATTQEILARTAAAACKCGALATTTIAGASLCDACAIKAPRFERPPRLA